MERSINDHKNIVQTLLMGMKRNKKGYLAITLKFLPAKFKMEISEGLSSIKINAQYPKNVYVRISINETVKTFLLKFLITILSLNLLPIFTLILFKYTNCINGLNNLKVIYFRCCWRSRQ